MTVNKLRFLADQGDVGMREDGLYTCTELGHYLRHAFTSLSESGRVDVSLGGDTAHVETCAAHLGALEDDYLETLLCGIFSGAVPTGARTDDNQIYFRH